MQELLVQSLSQQDPLKDEMATHFSILAWKNPMDRGAGQVMVYGGHKRVGHDLATKQQQHDIHQSTKYRSDSN